MKPDEFEQRLQRQALRQIPAEWREAILVAADVNRRNQPIREFTFAATTFRRLLSTILWPHPKAWAGLAAVWILILAVDFSIRDKTPVMAEKFTPPSPEMVAELKQQQRMLVELIGARDPSDADRSKPLVPRPRTERVEIATV
ncbi:MAG: hypothetical protein ABSA45_08190 [Verrucomicrobiota bacterium]|jgi:hypothetical protein